MADLVLEIVEGPDAGAQVELVGPIGIGRDPSCDLSLTDELVSRHHAKVTPRDGSAVAEDLGSVNGTFLNGSQLHGEFPFGVGDHLLLGVTVVELRARDDLKRRPTAVRPKPAAFAIPERKPSYIPSEILIPDSGRHAHRLDPLLDARTKHRARMAPLGIALLVTIAIILFLALR